MLRLFSFGRTNTGGPLLCAYCLKVPPRLKKHDRLMGGSFPRTIYKCKDCGGLVGDDGRPIHHLGDPQDPKTWTKDPYAGETRRKKSLPPFLSQKLKGGKKNDI